MIEEPNFPRLHKDEYLTFRRAYDEYDDRWTIAEIMKYVAPVMQQYGLAPEQIRIDFNTYYDDPKELEVVFNRPETDAEYTDRVKRQRAYEAKKIADRERRKRTQQEKDLAQLAKLRKKYPDA